MHVTIGAHQRTFACLPGREIIVVKLARVIKIN